MNEEEFRIAVRAEFAKLAREPFATLTSAMVHEAHAERIVGYARKFKLDTTPVKSPRHIKYCREPKCDYLTAGNDEMTDNCPYHGLLLSTREVTDDE